jgi:hypothetical protein
MSCLIVLVNMLRIAEFGWALAPLMLVGMQERGFVAVMNCDPKIAMDHVKVEHKGETLIDWDFLVEKGGHRVPRSESGLRTTGLSSGSVSVMIGLGLLVPEDHLKDVLGDLGKLVEVHPGVRMGFHHCPWVNSF